MSFNERLAVLRFEAIDYITNVLKDRGTGYELIDPNLYDGTLDDGIGDEVYDIPRGYVVGKYGSYTEYPIVVVNIDDKDNRLTFEGLGCLDEGNNEGYIFETDELGVDVLCGIASMIQDLER